MKKFIILALILSCYLFRIHSAQVRDIDRSRAIRASRRNGRRIASDRGPCPNTNDASCSFAGDSRPKGNVDYNPWEFRDAFKEYYVRYPYHGYFNYGSSFARIKRY